MKIRRRLKFFYWLHVENRMPECVRYWREFLKLPVRKILDKNGGVPPESFGGGGTFVCTCCEHVNHYLDYERDVVSTVMGYYVCDYPGCRRTATHEVFDGLREGLRDFDVEDYLPEDEEGDEHE